MKFDTTKQETEALLSYYNLIQLLQGMSKITHLLQEDNNARNASIARFLQGKEGLGRAEEDLGLAKLHIGTEAMGVDQ